MAKKGIHPKYHKIIVEQPDNTSFESKSTYGKEGTVIKCDLGPSNHQAWTGKNLSSKGAKKIVKFQEKFGNIFD